MFSNSAWERKKKKNDIFHCLRRLHMEFSCSNSMFICIIPQFCSSPVFFFFLP
jgi:hypothetical protein